MALWTEVLMASTAPWVVMADASVAGVLLEFCCCWGTCRFLFFLVAHVEQPKNSAFGQQKKKKRVTFPSSSDYVLIRHCCFSTRLPSARAWCAAGKMQGAWRKKDGRAICSFSSVLMPPPPLLGSTWGLGSLCPPIILLLLVNLTQFEFWHSSLDSSVLPLGSECFCLLICKWGTVILCCFLRLLWERIY